MIPFQTFNTVILRFHWEHFSARRSYVFLTVLPKRSPSSANAAHLAEQVYKDAVQSELCEAIHLTRVFRDDIECDAFFPELDPSTWRAWASSTPKRDGDTRYSFVSYVRGPTKKDADDWKLPLLPACAPTQHEELQVGEHTYTPLESD